MNVENYQDAINEVREKLKGKEGYFEVTHIKRFEDHLKNNYCDCPVNLKIYSQDSKHEIGLFLTRHIFTDRVIEPFDKLGNKYGAMVAHMKNGEMIVSPMKEET